ncbi:type VII secretion protein EccE [Dactylosporangium sp. NPDC000555]|uniref:type VII secretion protein EccE n=1 Tax=Dactylosporangium sp. NPDC000555 TaxID=3154260 RepID=UPI003328067B
MTTDSQGPVRASARVGVEPASDPSPATLAPRRRPSHLGPIHVLQVVAVEAAILGLLAALDQGVLVIVPVALAGLLIAVVALGRQKSRWWLERRVLAWHFNRRAKRRPAGPVTDPRLAPLRTLAPRLTVQDVPVSDDSVIGVARDDAGWFAVAEVTPAAAMADGPSGHLPLESLVTTLTGTGQPGSALQVVTHTLGSPSHDLQQALPAAYSYRELVQRFGTAPIPADRVTWVAVRLDARALAEAGAESAENAVDVVAAMLRKVARTLRGAGVNVRILDRGGVLTALERSCDLQRTDDTAPPPQPRETWDAWHSAGLAHRSYWVQDWPAINQDGAVGALGDQLAAVPGSFTSVAFVIVPGAAADAQVDVRCLVRIAAPAETIAAVCQVLEGGTHGAHLLPLDGEQGPATYATAPTGGGPR